MKDVRKKTVAVAASAESQKVYPKSAKEGTPKPLIATHYQTHVLILATGLRLNRVPPFAEREAGAPSNTALTPGKRSPQPSRGERGSPAHASWTHRPGPQEGCEEAGRHPPSALGAPALDSLGVGSGAGWRAGLADRPAPSVPPPAQAGESSPSEAPSARPRGQEPPRPARWPLRRPPCLPSEAPARVGTGAEAGGRRGRPRPAGSLRSLRALVTRQPRIPQPRRQQLLAGWLTRPVVVPAPRRRAVWRRRSHALP